MRDSVKRPSPKRDLSPRETEEHMLYSKNSKVCAHRNFFCGNRNGKRLHKKNVQQV